VKERDQEGFSCSNAREREKRRASFV